MRRAGRSRARRAGAAVALACATLSLGCQTMRSFQEGCADVYSGVRYYGDQIGTLPFDGKLFFTLDLPLTAVTDTLLLPLTAFAEPERPQAGFAPGCRWADPRAR